MKAYTDLEQSQKLAEILPPESADMYYYSYMSIGEPFYMNYPNVIEDRQKLAKNDIPCWSLAALVELLPPFIQQSRFGRYTSYWLHMTKRTIRYEYYGGSYDGYDYLLRATDDNDCLLDAVYSAIIKLKEKDLL